MTKLVAVAFAASTLFGATSAMAQANYTTAVTVAYDPNAPSYTGGNFASASNNSSYVVRTGEDANFLYVDVTSMPNPATNTSLQFSNIYLGGTNFNTGLIFEVTNNRVSTTANPGNYYSLAGTGFSSNVATNDISFALPFSFLETNPLGITGFNNQTPGSQVRVSYSQSFGYSLVYGGYLDPVNRLGAQIIPVPTPGVTGAVPEPASWAMLILGMGAVGYALRRRQSLPFSYAA